jgi:hypothetical protein
MGMKLGLILKEQLMLMVFENSVLRRILGCRRDELIGDWRKLHNEELDDYHTNTLYPAYHTIISFDATCFS